MDVDRPCFCEKHNPRVPSKAILDDIDNHFGKAKLKDDVIRALERCNYLNQIPLPPPIVTLEQAEKDFCRERVLLNDVAFVPDKFDLDRAHAFSLTLRMLLRRMLPAFSNQLYKDSDHICDILMQRACRTSAGSDSFFTVQKMLCVEGTFVTQKTLVNDPPIHIDVFLGHHESFEPVSHPVSPAGSDSRGRSFSDARPANGSRQTPSLSAPPVIEQTPSHIHSTHYEPSLCARIQVSNSFAIYDVAAMDLLGETDDFFSEQDDLAAAEDGVSAANNHTRERSPSTLAPLPWLDVESVVIDESNFRTGRHWRRLHLLVSCPATGQVFSSDHHITSATARSPKRNQRDDKMSSPFEDWTSDGDGDQSDDHFVATHRLSSRRVFRELAQWLAASSSGLRLSSGQRSQTQQSAPTSHPSLPRNASMSSNATNIPAPSAIDIASRHLPALPTTIAYNDS